jgi:hypothetical protein
MRRPTTMGVLVLLILLIGAACSVDVSGSDEYQALEAELAAVSQAEEEAVSDAEEARADAETERAKVQEVQTESDVAIARAEEAETALDELMNIEWPEAMLVDLVSECEGGSVGDTDLTEADVAMCSCFVHELTSTVSFIDTMLMGIETIDSEAELNAFGFPVDMDPEFAEAIGTATATCMLSSSPGTETEVLTLAVGTCFDDPDAFDLVDPSDVPIVECDVPHDNEVYASRNLKGIEFPGREAMADRADEVCLAEFAPYIGTAYEDSIYEFSWSVPSEESWDQDDREVICFAYDLNLDKITGSINGIEQ